MSREDVEDEYGPPPSGMERPDHPDFETLIEVVTEGLDEASTHEGFDLEGYIAQYIDAKSLSYMALQRALRAFKIESPEQMAQAMDQLMVVCALYLEGFLVGTEFRVKTEPESLDRGLLRRLLNHEQMYVQKDEDFLLLDGSISLLPPEQALVEALREPQDG